MATSGRSGWGHPRPSQIIELESDSVRSSLPDPVPQAADGDGIEEKSVEGAGEAKLGSFLEDVEGFNDINWVHSGILE